MLKVNTRVYLLFIGALLLSNLQAKENLRLNITFNDKEFDFIAAIWTEVARRNDVELIIQKMPNKRSLLNVNLGIDDAESARIRNISKYYPNLIAVPEPIYQLNIIALTKKDNMGINELKNLKPYHIGIIRGTKIAEVKVASIQPRSIIKITDYKTLLKLLDNARIDVAFVDKEGILNEISKSKTEKQYFLYSPALIHLDLYMQLNKKHKKYLLPFQKSLLEIKKEGIYQHLYEKYLKIEVPVNIKITDL